MSIALYRKTIHCPNCHYEGKTRVKGTGGWLALFAVIALIAGFFIWPLLIIAAILFLVAIFRPAKQICPKCKWEHPVPLSQWEQNNTKEKS